MKLGVNVDHVATLRNLRGTPYPSVASAARTAMVAGASFVTVHLREDRRHIRDSDLAELVRDPELVINLEMAPTEEMLSIALNYRPSSVCFVPERREEVTTEHGLDVKSNSQLLQEHISILQQANISVTLFVDPIKSQIYQAYRCQANCVELHVGDYCAARAKDRDKYEALRSAASQCVDLGIECHAGHGIDYESAASLASIPGIKALNVGHFLICDALNAGMTTSIRKMLKIIT